jgi:hypothetical protein
MTTRHIWPQRYVLVPAKATKAVKNYWFDLYRADLLKYRLCDVKNPLLKDVKEMIDSPSTICFYCFDFREERVCGEVMLNNWTGALSQVHFSIHPDYKGQKAVDIARSGAEQLFNIVLPTGKRCKTLVGMLPVTNRLAIALTRKVGYVFKTILTNCFLLSYADDAIVDGYVTQLTEEDLIWGRKGQQEQAGLK